MIDSESAVTGMFVAAVLAPGLVLVAIPWTIVGVLRRRRRGQVTGATLAALYARIVMVSGLLVALAGLAILAKVGLSLIDPGYSYFVPPETPPAPPGYVPPPTLARHQAADLALAAVLCGAGLLAAGSHRLVALLLDRLAGGSPAWLAGGTLAVFAWLTGLAAVLSISVAGLALAVRFLLAPRSNVTFGEPAGSALVFLSAWAVVTLLRRRRRREGVRPADGGRIPA